MFLRSTQALPHCPAHVVAGAWPLSAILCPGALRPTCPGAKDRVARRCGSVVLADREQFASRQPAHGRLHGALRDADAFCHFPIADLNRLRTALLLHRKPQVDQEADRPTVMADQVPQEDFDNVIVKREQRYTNY